MIAADVPGLDALLPPEMARRAEEIGVKKAGMDAVTLLALAVLAGAFIALGGVFATVALAGAETAPWSMTRVLAGVVFSVGLILVVVGGAELFTGNNLIVMAWAGGRIGTRALLRNWALVYAGNFLGALSIALAVVAAGTHHAGSGAFGATAVRIAADKLRPDFAQAVVSGILCNVLVCLAVWLTYSARTTADRIWRSCRRSAPCGGRVRALHREHVLRAARPVHRRLRSGFVAARGLEAPRRSCPGARPRPATCCRHHRQT